MKQSIKIKKLIVKNYRGIGNDGLEIDVDDIVVLVGPNNSGKSTILRAFELVTTTNTKIKQDDFFNQKYCPEIQIWSEILDENVCIDSKKWVDPESHLVKEKWTWSCPDTDAERIGYRVDINDWAKSSDTPKAPFSNDGAATAYRPIPTYISPFEQPEKQVEEIKKIVSAEVYELIKKQKKEDESYQKLLENIGLLQEAIRKEASEKERSIADNLEEILKKLFSDTKITLEVPPNNPDILDSYASAKDINFKIDNLSLENQGSGMQRVLLWSVLKMLAGRAKSLSKKANKSARKKEEVNTDSVAAERTKVLLIDEPEICLHPDSIRQAKDILYELSSTGEWQIMITTHSPVFIDLSKNNTNIIRVQKEDEVVSLFKTNDAELSNDEKEQIKMLNIFDPYFAEFFFSKTTVVVEGDTEYTAFRKIIETDKLKYKDIHIIRARGKYTILPIVKILKKWGKNFSILHDSDEEKNAQSWPANQRILDLVSGDVKIKLLATKINFENAFFEVKAEKDKPYNAYTELNKPNIFSKISKLLDYLCDIDTTLHADIQSCVFEYKTINELKNFIR